MSRMKRMLKEVQKELKNKSQKSRSDEELVQSPECLDVSSIDKASFLQGEQFSSHGNPLHSTALEDECSPEPVTHPKATAKTKAGEDRVKKKCQEVAGTPKRHAYAKKDQSKTKKSTVQTHKESSKSKRTQRLKQKQKTQQETSAQPQSLQTSSENREGSATGTAQSEVSEADVSEDEISSDNMSPDGPAKSQRQSSSSEELTDEDESFHPSSKKHQPSNAQLQRGQRSSGHQQGVQKQKRKSSSGSSDNGNRNKKQKQGAVKNPLDLDIVLEAFQQFVTQYKETVSSDSVKRAIDALSHSFEEQLNEMITATKKFNDVRRKAAKINSNLNRKKYKLLEAKNELIKSEAEVRTLQKEHDGLEQRLKALKQGTAFLTNLKMLKQKYSAYCIAHPDEPRSYGPSCMPAMLLEARSIMGAENQLKIINDKLQQALEENGHK